MVQLYSRVSRSLALPISTMPRFIIPLADKLNSSICRMPATFARNTLATYIDDGVLQTAAIDVPRFQNGRYLAEPTATNLFLQSGDFSLDITDIDNLVSDPIHGGPFSNVTSNLIGLTSGTQYVFKIISLTAGTYCFSQYVKLGNATSVGYAIYSVTTASWVVTQTKYTGLSTSLFTRVFNTFTLASDQTVRIYVKRYIDATSLGTSYHFGGQLATSLTSYIPTTSSAVTRDADVLHYDVSSAITQGQGSLYCYGIMRVVGQNQRLLNLSDNTTSNRLYITLLANGYLAAYIISGSTVQASMSYGIPPSNGIIKALLTYEDNNTSFYVNGVLVGTDITCQIPGNLTKLNIGCAHDGTLQLNSEIGNVKYFKEVLTPAEAIKLTTV